MKTSSTPTKAQKIIVLNLTLIPLLLVTLFGLVWPESLVRAGPTLPPIDPSPSSTRTSKGEREEAPPIAYIELHASVGVVGNWSVVQWVDTAGNWHDVEGWRGSFFTGMGRRWVVEAKDFGTGPFRWAVTDEPGGTITGLSETFYLPTDPQETLQIGITSP